MDMDQKYGPMSLFEKPDEKGRLGEWPDSTIISKLKFKKLLTKIKNTKNSTTTDYLLVKYDFLYKKSYFTNR